MGYPVYSRHETKTVWEPVPDIDMTLEIGGRLLASVFPFKHPVRLFKITL